MNSEKSRIQLICDMLVLRIHIKTLTLNERLQCVRFNLNEVVPMFFFSFLALAIFFLFFHGVGTHPKNIVFLACDAFGVLPPVSKLTKDQAMYHFVTGYTAKVAGTEIGVKEPVTKFNFDFQDLFFILNFSAKFFFQCVKSLFIFLRINWSFSDNFVCVSLFQLTIFSLTCLETRHQTKNFSSLLKVETFSACFGEAFLVHHPSKYGELLKEKIEEHDSQVWLINTGWVKGGYGKGSLTSFNFPNI